MKERDSLYAKPKGLLQFSTEHGCHDKECQQHLKYRNQSQYFSAIQLAKTNFLMSTFLVQDVEKLILVMDAR